MRKILLLIGLIISGTHLLGQTVKFDIDAGINTSTYAERESAEGKAIPEYFYRVNDLYSPGYHIGMLAKLNWGRWGIQTGATFITKGGYAITNIQIPPTTLPILYQEYAQRKLNYLEVPLNVTYNIPFEGHKFFIGGGPYVENGLAGKLNLSYTGVSYLGTITGGNNRTIGFGDRDVKSPAYGINILTGADFKSGLSFSAGYSFGINNISGNGNVLAENRTVWVSLGYTLFTTKKIDHFHLFK